MALAWLAKPDIDIVIVNVIIIVVMFRPVLGVALAWLAKPGKLILLLLLSLLLWAGQSLVLH